MDVASKGAVCHLGDLVTEPEVLVLRANSHCCGFYAVEMRSAHCPHSGEECSQISNVQVRSAFHRCAQLFFDPSTNETFTSMDVSRLDGGCLAYAPSRSR